MPAHVDALHCLGVLYHQCGQPQDALVHYDRVIAVSPQHIDAWSNRTQALAQLGRLADALNSADTTLRLAPQLPEALFLRAHVLRMTGQLTQAIDAYEKLTCQVPNHAQGWLGKGLAHAALQQLSPAMACFRQVIQLHPQDIDAHNNLGVMLQESGELKASIQAFEQALKLNPDHTEAHTNQGVSYLNLGDDEKAKVCFKRALSIDPGHAVAQSHLLFLMCFSSQTDPAGYVQQARAYGQLLASQISAPGPFTQWPAATIADLTSTARLRIGFVSADLRNHSVGHFVESLVKQLHPQDVELVAYHNSPIEDDTSARLRRYFSAWHVVHSWSDEALAEQIHREGIQILVDLSGHTAGHRLPVFARRPAPVQVSWLGYLASTGVPGMDYFLVDPITAPVAHADHFTEELWHLPHTVNCLAIPETGHPLDIPPLPALKAGHITFGCFQTRAKMNTRVLQTWTELLASLPGSRLLIQSKTLSEAPEQHALLRHFTEAGIAADRITIEGGLPARIDVLRNYQRIDIALDTFPYPGITTTCEALWMGVPVLTLSGNTLLSRQGASLMTAAGLPAWIAQDTRQYIQLAVAHAHDLQALASLRLSLREQVQLSPLFNAPLFAQHWLQAMQGMWKQRQSRH